MTDQRIVKLQLFQQISRSRGETLTPRILMVFLLIGMIVPVVGVRWSVAWGISVIGAQLYIDYLFVKFDEDIDFGRRNAFAFCMVAVIANGFYSAGAIILWSANTPDMQVAAILFLCIGVAYVSSRLSGSIPFFSASISPYSVLLVILPASSWFRDDELMLESSAIAMAVIFLGVVLVAALTRHRALVQNAQALLDLAQERETAIAASAAKSSFVAAVSHELRTPMNAVLGAAELLSRTPLSPRQAELIQLMRESGETLTVIVSDLLDLAKIEANKLAIERVAFDLRALVADAGRLWRPNAEAKSLRLEVEIAADAPHWVMGDPTRVRQILHNFISNAIKFTEKGAICISLGLDEAGASQISVKDSGIGMTPQALARIFQAFEQASDSTARQYGGTGLGLAISSKLARLMRGAITAESDLGLGSRFTLLLPLDAIAPPNRQENPAATAAAGLMGRMILVAEDNLVNQQVLRLLLAPTGAAIVFANDGEEALAHLSEADFDAALMDVQMPKLDGLAATRQLRAGGGRNAQIPVIALTANATSEDRQACRAAGMTGFVSKPIRSAELIEALEAAFAAPTAHRRAAQAS